MAYFRHIGASVWGINNPLDGLLALKQTVIANPVDAWPQPSPRDIWVFYRILDLLRGLPSNSKARSVIKDVKLLSVNKLPRCETVLEELAFIGILETPDHPGMFTRFNSAVERDRRQERRVEVPAPLAWWTAGGDINEVLVLRLLGHLKRPEAEPPQPVSSQSARCKSAGYTPRPKAISGPVAAGDIYAVRYHEDLWGAVYCHEVQTDQRGYFEPG